jgi:hypothetical protein
MPRPTLVTKDCHSITLNLLRGKAIAASVPPDCVLEVRSHQFVPKNERDSCN